MAAAIRGRTATRLAVIGDVGGHLDTFIRALCSLGLDPRTSRLPDDLVVVQVGDLVHRGPDSDAVVTFVDTLMAVNGTRWVQLVGNHEAQYLFPPAFRWPERVAPSTAEILRRWWDGGAMTAAAAFDVSGVSVRRPGGRHESTGAGGLLVTHAGLTVGCWDALGNPTSARDAADAVNASRFDPAGPVWRAGSMLERRVVAHAGPVWAEPSAELYLPWVSASRRDTIDGGCPGPGFHQAHGHASSFRWDAGQWSRTDLAELFSPLAHVDRDRRHVRLEVGEQVLWGVDPVHGRSPAPRWAPLVLGLTEPAGPTAPSAAPLS